MLREKSQNVKDKMSRAVKRFSKTMNAMALPSPRTRSSVQQHKIGAPHNVTRECSLSENLEWKFSQDGMEGSNPNGIFQLGQKIGEGSFATVFIAENTTNGESVAIKRMVQPSKPKHVTALSKEITVLRAGAASEYLVNYYGSYHDAEHIYLVMEYCSRGSLHDVIKGFKRFGSMSEPTIRGIVQSIVKGLVFLHSKGIVHRDLKTQNILIDELGRVRLADFGVAALLKGEAQRAHTIVGTPLFMAPEVLQGEPYTGKADCWSLGICAITLAEGVVPRRGRSVARLMELIIDQPAPRLRKPQNFSADFEDFVNQCLIKSQQARPTSQQLSEHPWISERTSAEDTCAKLRHRTIARVPKVTPKMVVQSVFSNQNSPKRKLQTTPRKQQQEQEAPPVEFKKPRTEASMLSDSSSSLTTMTSESAMMSTVPEVPSRPPPGIYETLPQHAEEDEEDDDEGLLESSDCEESDSVSSA